LFIIKEIKSCSMNNENKSDTPENLNSAGYGETLYDLSMVRSVSGGDEAFIKKMIQLFIETVPPSLVDLKEAEQQQQWERVGKVAHKLKSTIDSMGISSLKEDIRAVETNGKQQQNIDTIPALIQKVDSIVNACILQLKTNFSL
jgi:HPt (histidine-containing phosphotransfer) domain-containing protein